MREAFSHWMTNSNKINNFIESLIIDGTISTYSFVISEHIVQFYNNLYTEQFSWWPKLDNLFYDY
jgi:hypothetical protein